MRQIFDGVNNAWLSSWFKFCWIKFDKICQIIQMLDISWLKLFSQLVLLGKQWESSAWGSSPPEPVSLMITMYRFWDIDECISYELRTKELSNELFFSSSVSQYRNFYFTVQKRQCINDNLHQFFCLDWSIATMPHCPDHYGPNDRLMVAAHDDNQTIGAHCTERLTCLIILESLMIAAVEWLHCQLVVLIPL